MITVVVKEICDRLILLLEYRHRSQRQYCQDHVEPIFQYLLTVHADYSRRISKVLHELALGSNDVIRIRATLAEHREELLHIRGLVMALARTLREHPDRSLWYRPPLREHRKPPQSCREAACVFAFSALHYLLHGSGVDPAEPGTGYTVLLDLIDGAIDGDMPSSILMNDIVQVRENLQHAWRELADAYASARSLCYAM